MVSQPPSAHFHDQVDGDAVWRVNVTTDRIQRLFDELQFYASEQVHDRSVVNFTRHETKMYMLRTAYTGN